MVDAEKEFWEELGNILKELVKKAKSFDDLVRDEKLNKLFWDAYIRSINWNDIPDFNKQFDKYITQLIKAFKSLEKFCLETVKSVDKHGKLNWHAGIAYLPCILDPDSGNTIETLKQAKNLKELKAKIDELAKAGKLNKDRVILIPHELSEFFKEFGKAEFEHFLLYFNAGINVGYIFSLITARNAMIFKMAELEREIRNPADRLLALYLWLIREDKPNEMEKEIIKKLYKSGYSYRDIAKLCNRSLDTIHRIIKS